MWVLRGEHVLFLPDPGGCHPQKGGHEGDDGDVLRSVVWLRWGEFYTQKRQQMFTLNASLSFFYTTETQMLVLWQNGRQTLKDIPVISIRRRRNTEINVDLKELQVCVYVKNKCLFEGDPVWRLRAGGRPVEEPLQPWVWGASAAGAHGGVRTQTGASLSPSPSVAPPPAAQSVCRWSWLEKRCSLKLRQEFTWRQWCSLCDETLPPVVLEGAFPNPPSSSSSSSLCFLCSPALRNTCRTPSADPSPPFISSSCVCLTYV